MGWRDAHKTSNSVCLNKDLCRDVIFGAIHCISVLKSATTIHSKIQSKNIMDLFSKHEFSQQRAQNKKEKRSNIVINNTYNRYYVCLNFNVATMR